MGTDGSGAGGVHNEFHGVADFVVMANDIRGSINYAPTFVIASADPLDVAARELARVVGAQWRAEAGMRGLLDVSPLATCWSADWGEYTDHQQLVGGQVGGDDAGDLRSLTDTFLRLPRRRLVVLGGPGSGKSTLAVLLLLSLLDQCPPQDPVPVLFPIASWDPERHHLNTWLADRLNRDYPRLRQSGLGGSAAARLIEARRILPILDGLDEMPPQRRARAMLGLNEALAGDHPVILTCRTSEYRSVIRDADIVRQAATIHANRVEPHRLLTYLRTAISPQRHARWRPVFVALEDDQDSPLAGALSSPLMISLLRTIYGNADADPAVLLDTRRFPTTTAIENHLLDSLTTAAFPTGPPSPNVPGRRRRWQGAQAEHWLRHLAVDLTRLNTEDLCWWQFHRHAPYWVRALISGLLIGGTSFLFIVCRVDIGVLSATDHADPSLEALLVFGAVVGVLTGGLSALIEDEYSPPPDAVRVWNRAGSLDFRPDWSPTRIRTPTRLFWEIQRFANMIGAVIVTGLALVLGAAYLLFGVLLSLRTAFDNIAHTLSNVFPSPAWLLLLPSCLGLVMWLAAMLVRPFGREDAPTPRRGLRRGRRRALAIGAAWGGGMMCFLVLWRAAGGAVAAGVITGNLLLIATVVVGGTAMTRAPWARYEKARLWLTMRGRLPWRLTTFLEDAHRLGVLRQFGTTYQFRHDRLRERLASADHREN